VAKETCGTAAYRRVKISGQTHQAPLTRRQNSNIPRTSMLTPRCQPTRKIGNDPYGFCGGDCAPPPLRSLDKEVDQIRLPASLLVQVRPLNVLTASRWFGSTMLSTTSRPDTRIFSITSTRYLLYPRIQLSKGEETGTSTLVTGYRARPSAFFPEDLLVIEAKARGSRMSRKGVPLTSRERKSHSHHPNLEYIDLGAHGLPAARVASTRGDGDFHGNHRFGNNLGVCSPVSGISVSSITGPVGIGTGVTVVGWEGVCQLTLLACWCANGVLRSSSMSRSCSWPKVA